MSRSSGSSQESTSTTASSWTSRRAAARRPWNASGPHRRASALPTATTRVISAPPSGPPTPRPELYDLAKDPGETHNLLGEKKAVAEEMRAKLTAMIRDYSAGKELAEKKGLDPASMD